MTIKKELICHIETLEEGEFVKVNAIDTEPGYFLLSLGQARIPVNGAELINAMNSIDYYSVLFKQEALAMEQRKAAPAKAMVVSPAASPKRGKKSQEPEGTFEFDAALRTGPTASELALEAQTKHMKGETLVIRENK